MIAGGSALKTTALAIAAGAPIRSRSSTAITATAAPPSTSDSNEPATANEAPVTSIRHFTASG
ncbi:hypothetical protein [Allobranchiibius sp. GilTou73]|uniref:hypothetical protein n=1 Tax=Allobranchiibius sp. GilTou73 TaxID=2904523 RepID=UPI001F1A83BE|nr:hypothetical protein [Allobranchiibius sp. GilTou73]UIJ34752.1 hypothetical protein LVQ62_16915 [Allobranchiibius sp. GilTou73]